MAAREFKADRKHAPVRLGRVLVLGLGKSGRAAVDYLLPLLGTRVDELAVAAGASDAANAAFAEAARARGARVEFDHEVIAGTYDLCIASPGIPQVSPFYASAAAASAEVVSEVEFAWRESARDSRWVAVTGTNGKTTTVALIEHLLREAGVSAKAVGNIGDTCLEAVAAHAAEAYVAEVSSFQLASTRDFAPDVAVVLNITPDHVNWHGGFEAYRQAKLKVLANMGGIEGALAVLDATDDVVRETVRELRRDGCVGRGLDYVPVGAAPGLACDMRERCGSRNAAFLAEGDLLRVALDGREHDLVRTCDLQIKGAHNAANALAASAAALAMGAGPEAVARGLATFEPLEHRIEPCATVRGVACYNDSKATNVDATLVALAAFGDARPIVLLGGRDKHTDLAPLVEAARAHAKAVVCFGEAADRFLGAFDMQAAGQPPVPLAGRRQGEGSPDGGGMGLPSRPQPQPLAVLRAAHLADAFDAALDAAEPGDVVLLSPACASFDEFSSFEERGRAFKALAADRAGLAACARG